MTVGGLSWLLVESAVQRNSATDTGLLPLAERLQDVFAGKFASTLIRSTPALHRSTSAALILITIATMLLVLRSLTGSLAKSQLRKHLASVILRLRQHLHRKAIRMEPADLTGSRLVCRSIVSAVHSATRSRRNGMGFPVGHSIARDGSCDCHRGSGQLARRTSDDYSGCDWSHGLSSGNTAERCIASSAVEQVDRGLSRMAEGLKKTRIVTSFGMEQGEHQQFESHLGDYQKRCRIMQRQQSLGRGIRRAILLAVALVSSILLVMRILNGDHPAMIVIIGCCLVVIYRGLETVECRHELASEGGVKAEEIAAYINRIPSVSQVLAQAFCSQWLALSRSIRSSFRRHSRQDCCAGWT